jgi:hypothetical protein
MTERSQVTARDFFGLEAEAVPGDLPLQGEREEPVVAPGQHPGGHLRPGGERPRLGEDRRPFSRRRGVGPHHVDERAGQVVEEQRFQVGHVHLGAAVAVGRRLRGRLPADVVPPLTRCLARAGNHGVDRYQSRYGDVGAGQRGTEAAQGLSDQDHRAVKCTGGRDDQVAVLGQARRGIGPRQIDRYRPVAAAEQFAGHQVPVPALAAGARH